MSTQDSTGYWGKLIVDQTKLTLPYGRKGSAASGCAWVAVYNALHLLGLPADTEEIRRTLERFLILGGGNGTPFYAPALYLRQKGLRVHFCTRRKQLARRIQKAPVSILFYLYKGSRIFPDGHFTTLNPTSDGRLHFLNDFPGATDDIRTLRQFRKDRAPYFMVLMEIRR